MEAIFTTDDLPKRRLTVKTTLANRFASSAGRELEIMRENVVRQIAQKCAESDDLVRIVADGPFVKLSADCIVLTTDELADLMRKQFRAGVDHAQHFMPHPTAHAKGGGDGE